LHGEVVCTVHEVRARCVFCARPDPGPGPQDWRPFSRGHLRCPTCVVGAVETQEEARAQLPAVREHMAHIGVELTSRVPVRVIDPDEVDHLVGDGGDAVLLGLTDQWVGGGVRVQVAGIRILRGLPPIHFGRAVAHEIGHAWIAQHGSEFPAPDVEEGVCELFAYAWLKRQADPAAVRLRESIRHNPDRTYGAGFRSVYAATRTTDVSTVLAAVLRTGRLP
jgi:Protein DA1